MKMYGATDIGLVRLTNQDNFYVDKSGKWAVVADGMGGHNGGEIASSMTVEEIKKSMSQGIGLKESITNANTLVVFVFTPCARAISSYVDENEILDVLKTGKSSETVVGLIDAAKQNGGKDNITVVLIKA